MSDNKILSYAGIRGQSVGFDPRATHRKPPRYAWRLFQSTYVLEQTYLRTNILDLPKVQRHDGRR